MKLTFIYNRYTTFVRIGTGLSFADYVWVRQKPWKKYNPRDPPKFLQVSRKGTDDKPDLYLEPEEYVHLFLHGKCVKADRVPIARSF